MENSDDTPQDSKDPLSVPDRKPLTPQQKAAAERKQRLAASLRQNLRRRKAQAKQKD